MFKLHIISDLNLGFNEATDPVDETIPNVDLVILSGNIALLKRSALYAETLAKKYPETQFVWHLGETERYFVNVEKFRGEIDDSLSIRIKNNVNFPKNLHYANNDRIMVKLRTGQVVDVFCAYGFPKILSYEGDWEDTYWFQNYISDVQQDTVDFLYKPKETSNVQHGMLPIFATKEWINDQYEFTEKLLKKWENEVTGYKILITHINPYSDTRTINQKVSCYKIHLNNMAWVTSNTLVDNVQFLGAKLISNPGRGIVARSKVFVLD